MLDPRLAALSALLLVIGLGWGFGFAPRTISRGKLPDHVPSRSDGDVVDGAVPAMAVAAFVGVVWQIKMADLAIAARRRWGGLHPVALVSGAAWGKPMGTGGSGTPA